MSHSSFVWYPFTPYSSQGENISIKKAKGVILWDDKNNTYIDAISSWWVNVHGHCHPHLSLAISQQASLFEQIIFADFTHEPAETLAKNLCQYTQFSKIFFSDNGSTSIEVALKIAIQKNIIEKSGKNKILAFEGSYHGDTFGAMALGKTSGFYAPFHDYLFNVHFTPYPHTFEADLSVEKKESDVLQLIETSFQSGEFIAFIIEPLLQGAGGMRICRSEFLNKLLFLAQKYHVISIFDEVLTGFGRTGKMFAFEYLSHPPNILCLSKGITGGFMAMGATLVQESIYESFKNPSIETTFWHGHSYTANPMACSVANASWELFQKENTLEKINQINLWHKKYSQKYFENILHFRSCGSIAAFDLEPHTSYHSHLGPRLKKACLQKGLLIRPLGNVIYLMPPACIDEEQLEYCWKTLSDVMKEI